MTTGEVLYIRKLHTVFEVTWTSDNWGSIIHKETTYGIWSDLNEWQLGKYYTLGNYIRYLKWLERVTTGEVLYIRKLHTVFEVTWTSDNWGSIIHKETTYGIWSDLNEWQLGKYYTQGNYIRYLKWLERVTTGEVLYIRKLHTVFEVTWTSDNWGSIIHKETTYGIWSDLNEWQLGKYYTWETTYGIWSDLNEWQLGKYYT